MKIRHFLLVLPLLAFAACKDTASTTTPTTDSTATVNTPPAQDSAVAETTPPADSTAPAADPGTDPGTSGETGSKVANPGDIAPTFRLTVSFTSMGAGIDFNTKKTFDKFVIDFGKQHHVTLAYEQVGWGREGEIDYCFKLAELKDPAKTDFVNQAKKMLSGKETIFVKENASCRVKRK